MKKAVSIFLTIVMVFSLTACGTAESQEISDSSSTEESVVEFEQVASDGDSWIRNRHPRRKVRCWLRIFPGRTMPSWRMTWMPLHPPA